MNRNIIMLLIAIGILGLAAWGINNYQNQKPDPIENAADGNIVKFESEDIDFSGVSYELAESDRDVKLEEAILNALENQHLPEDSIRYYYNRIDLNGDEKPETFVYLISPVLSGTGGDTAMVFEGNEDNYELVSTIALARNPVIVSEEKTNGWNDLFMSVYGGGIEPFYAQLQFNGKQYPENPSVQPEVTEGTIVKGTAIISDDLAKNPGIELNS